MLGFDFQGSLLGAACRRVRRRPCRLAVDDAGPLHLYRGYSPIRCVTAGVAWPHASGSRVETLASADGDKHLG
jgi:hypothetical protein